MLMLLWQISTAHRETGRDNGYSPLQCHLHRVAQSVVRNYCHKQRAWWHLWWEWPQLLPVPDKARASTLLPPPARGDALKVWGNPFSGIEGSSGVLPELGSSWGILWSQGPSHSHPCIQELFCSKKWSSRGSERLHWTATLLLVKNSFIFYFNESYLWAKKLFAERVCGFEEWERAVNRFKSFSNNQQSAWDVNSSF